MTHAWDPRWPPLDPGRPMRAVPLHGRVALVEVFPAWVRRAIGQPVVRATLSCDEARRVLETLPDAIRQAEVANER